MRLSRDNWITIGVLSLLAILTAAAAIRQAKPPDLPPLASFSDAPDGARALSLWLDQIGFTVLNDSTVLNNTTVLNDNTMLGDSSNGATQPGVFELPTKADFAFILEPTEQITDAEWRGIDNWVESGGTLVLAGSSYPAFLAMDHYQFSFSFLETPDARIIVQAPWSSPPVPQVHLGTSAMRNLQTERSDFVTHLGSAAGPLLVSFSKGDGRVFLSATAYPFTNKGLKEAGNPGIVTNLLSFGDLQGLPGKTGQTPMVWFDEWHHGVRGGQWQIIGPGQWLRRAPAGQALLFTAAAVFIVLALQGRRFGRPVPLAKETIRRRPLEYITALANLSRRAGHRSEILARYYKRLKRRLGARYRLDPELPDERWAAELAHLRPDLDTAGLLDLLKRLHRPFVSENELVKLARESAEWMDDGTTQTKINHRDIESTEIRKREKI